MPIIGFDAPLEGAHLALSALPNAPVLPDKERPLHAHSRTAAALRAVSRRTARLANRLDPACA